MSCVLLAPELLGLVASYLTPREHYIIAKGTKEFLPSLIARVMNVIKQLGRYVHPDSGYEGLPDLPDLTDLTDLTDLNYCNLADALRALWNIVIHVDISIPCDNFNSDDDPSEHIQLDYYYVDSIRKNNDLVALELLQTTFAILTMESDRPSSYDAMNQDILENIIFNYLDSEYDDYRFWLGGYKCWKYIYKAIDCYSNVHNLDTIEKQKHCLAILIFQYITHKNNIIFRYRNESRLIAYDAIYFSELCNLIATVSGKGNLGTRMIDGNYFSTIFDFFNPPSS
jgi:hypothetical protein